MRIGRGYMHHAAALVLMTLVTAVAPDRGSSQRGDLPSSSLAVDTGKGWRSWWSAKHAPSFWTSPHPALLTAMQWRPVQPGLDQTELRLRGSGEAWRVRVVMLRFDPSRFDLQLRSATSPDGLRALWTADSLTAPGILAFNGGHFEGGQSWGWLVTDGQELQPPGTGSLAMALVVDQDGVLRLLGPEEIDPARASGRVRTAIQSYPMLLTGEGVVPEPLRRQDLGVDVAHRDSRLAVGQLRDGFVVVVLTRFEALGGVLSALPFGLTVPEMAALMGAIGCRTALLLDGGISGQMAVRGADGRITRWKGLRRVPLAIEVVPRRERS